MPFPTPDGTVAQIRPEGNGVASLHTKEPSSKADTLYRELRAGLPAKGSGAMALYDKIILENEMNRNSRPKGR